MLQGHAPLEGGPIEEAPEGALLLREVLQRLGVAADADELLALELPVTAAVTRAWRSS